MKEGGQRTNVYLDAQARGLLERYAAETRLSLSNVVCGLIRAVSGEAAASGDERIYTDLKRVFGRENFLRFVAAVGKALPRGFQPVTDAGTDGDFKPDFWVWRSRAAGVYAFFSLSECNTERMIGTAFRLKSAHRLRTLIVVSLSDETDEAITVDLRKVGIRLATLGGLQRALDELK